MTLTEAYEVLRVFNLWRRGLSDVLEFSPTDIGIAIDIILAAKDKYIQLANEVGVAVLLSKVQRGELSNSNAIAELVNSKFEKL